MEQNPKYVINGFSLENVRNRHETRVIEAMRKLVPSRPDFCGCRLCVEDAYAIALNQLPAHYVQSGAMILRRQPPSEEQIERVVREALDKVAAQPNHGAAKEA